MTSPSGSCKEEVLAAALLSCLLGARRSAQKGKTGNMMDQRADSEAKTDSKGGLTGEKCLVFQRGISLRLLAPRLLRRVHIFGQIQMIRIQECRSRSSF